MPTPAASVLGMWLAAGLSTAVVAGGVGEGLAGWQSVQSTSRIVAGAGAADGAVHTAAAVSGVATHVPPDTSRRATLPPDTLTQRPALVPDTTPVADEEKPTRKTVLLTALAIAVLTISTLLLYNVRSR